MVNQYLARFGGSLQPILLLMFLLTLMCLLIFEPSQIVSLLLLVGSDEVIEAHNNFVKENFNLGADRALGIQAQDDNHNETRLTQAKVLMAMRADLGYSTSIDVEELLQLSMSPALMLMTDKKFADLVKESNH